MATRALLAFALLSIGSRASAGEVALTFDDAPVYGRFVPIDEASNRTARLLDGLRRHHLRAIAFVNEVELEGADKPARIGLLERWLDAGMDLGNHGYSHLSLTTTPLDLYIADTARGETVTKALLAAHGRTVRWFRYPFLETGPTLAIRRGFEAWLGSMAIGWRR